MSIEPVNIFERILNNLSEKDSCLEWKGLTNEKGYGRITVDYRQVSVHRLIYKLIHGEIPEGMLVCHHCDNPSCIKPKHLFLGTHNDNMNDMKAKARGSKNVGEIHGMSKLTEDEVKDIRKSYAVDGLTQQELAEIYEVSRVTIQRVVKKETWTHI